MEQLKPVDKPLSFNLPQMVSLINNAPIEVDISGRGTGKTSKRAWRFHRFVQTMPRSCSMIVTKTYRSLLQDTLSPLCEALERLGYYQDYQYVIGKRPPKGWDLAPHAPKTFENYMSFRNGTGWRFNSQDVSGGGRGPNVDAIEADEGLNLDKTKFETGALATNRGNLHKFKNNPLHHGISLTSSMPISASGQWILEFGKYYEEDGKNYWLIWNKVTRLQNEFLSERDSKKRSELIREWMELKKQIVFYKSKPKNNLEKPVLFTFYNCFDNLKNLGLQYIAEQKKMMTPLSFRIEMLNERLTAVEDCFYHIDEEVHLYEMWNNAYLQSLDYNFERIRAVDCRRDGDVDLTRPLELSIDYGHFINGMRVGQEHAVTPTGKKHVNFRFLKSLFVRPPFGSDKLIDNFCDYYSYHKTKRYKLYYDHTHHGGEGWRKPFIDDTVKRLTERGWSGELIYVGKAPFHNDKYMLWYKLLKSNVTHLPAVFFNRTNDKEGIVSMQLANVKKGKHDVEKDKSSERSAAIPREQATDLSDAGDTLIWGKYKHLIDSNRSFFDIVTN